MRIDRTALQKLSLGSFAPPIEREMRISEVFHENSKLGPVTSRAYRQHIVTVLRSPAMCQLLAQPGKMYSLQDRVALKRPRGETHLERSIQDRCSVRRFSGAAVDILSLGRLLYFSYGTLDSAQRRRGVPSGGGLYPLEIYVVPHRVDGLEEGVYHYAPEEHALNVVSIGPIWEAMCGEMALQGIGESDAAAMLVICAMFRRTTIKYLDRGYRLVLFEAGAVAQNLSLVGASIGIGSCLVGGFNDDNVAALLGVDGVDEAPLIPVVLGQRP